MSVLLFLVYFLVDFKNPFTELKNLRPFSFYGRFKSQNPFDLETLKLNISKSLRLPGNSSFGLFFWFPAIASGTYKFTSVRASVRTYVRASVRYSEISESVHRNFLKFGTKLGLPNATEVTFSDFAR